MLKFKEHIIKGDSNTEAKGGSDSIGRNFPISGLSEKTPKITLLGTFLDSIQDMDYNKRKKAVEFIISKFLENNSPDFVIKIKGRPFDIHIDLNEISDLNSTYIEKKDINVNNLLKYLVKKLSSRNKKEVLEFLISLYPMPGSDEHVMVVAHASQRELLDLVIKNQLVALLDGIKKQQD
ncbi:MAG: hypothetical protein WC356_01140 [Candidatus Micrarchaeia archaeon]|jgi:hypothetical protein